MSLAAAVLARFQGLDGREDLLQGQISAKVVASRCDRLLPAVTRRIRAAAHGTTGHPLRAALAGEVPVFALEDLARRDRLADDALDDLLNLAKYLVMFIKL